MLDYIPYSILFFIKHGTEMSEERNNRHAVNYLMFHALCSILSHTASIWLTVCVALFRYIYLSTKRGKELCSLSRANLTIGLVCFVSVLLSLPQILVLKVNEQIDPRTNETAYWYLSTNGLKENQNRAVNKAGYIVMAVLVKIGPSILLILLSLLLILIILKVQKRYQRIHTQKSKNSSSMSMKERKRQEQTNQTTKLLICVAIVFTIVELPHGILFVCNGIAPKVFEKVYYPLGNLFDLITIISCGVNFVLYCAMSTQFRRIFCRNLRTLFQTHRCVKKDPASPGQSTSCTDETIQPLSDIGRHGDSSLITTGTSSTIVSNEDALLSQGHMTET